MEVIDETDVTFGRRVVGIGMVSERTDGTVDGADEVEDETD